MARVGKIARLPLDIREELNRRLQDGEAGPSLLTWLNAQPSVLSVLSGSFGAQPINPQNLSDWRKGGFLDWEEKQSRAHRIKELAAYAAQLTAANSGSIAEGAAAIASGRILELLEAVDPKMDEKNKPSLEDLGSVIGSLTSLRGAEIAQQRADIDRGKLKQKDEELKLAREKFQRETAGIALKVLADDRARQIEAAPGSQEQKLDAMGQHLFGALWKPM
jgi:hypothetical protein